MGKTVGVEFTNMVMVEDGEKVLVQRRKLYWTGIAFPGGHIEKKESFTASAIREVKEETGLDIRNLRLCGTVDWENADTGERYVVLLYKTSDFSGTLLPETEEGSVFWVPKAELIHMDLCENFREYLRVFLEEDKTEFYGYYREDTNLIIDIT
ncbi:MAG: 8-oxo-dGTP diphosphatase [Ruminococcaceae bacterium]|nr:8-oxo-dGTP diphosphatase [Oscillospiraceae bacterium]